MRKKSNLLKLGLLAIFSLILFTNCSEGFDSFSTEQELLGDDQKESYFNESLAAEVDSRNYPATDVNPLGSISNDEMTRFSTMQTIFGNQTIVDNKDIEVQKTGTWPTSSAAKAYAGESVYSNSPSARFKFTPNIIKSGIYNVYTWHTYHINRSSRVPHRIKHRKGIKIHYVNQQNSAYAGRWRYHGQFELTSGKHSYVEVSAENGQASADAVLFNYKGPLPVSTPPPAPVNQPPTAPTNLKASALVNTTQINLSWTASKNDNGSVLYTIKENDKDVQYVLDTTSAQRKNLPAGLNYTYQIYATDSKGLRSPLSNKVTVKTPVAIVKTFTVDNSSANSTKSGVWALSSGANSFGNQSEYANSTGATYTFNMPIKVDGAYDVYARWTEWHNRSSAASYEIYTRNGIKTIKVNQKINGGQWFKLASAQEFDSSPAKIVLRSDGNGTVSADAVRVSYVKGLSAAPPPTPGPKPPGSNLVMNINFNNRVRNSTYTELQVIEDFNANTRDGAFYGLKSGSTRIVGDPAGGSARKNVMRVLHPAGKYAAGGVSFKARFAPDNEKKKGSARYDDIYFSYDIYLSKNTKRMPYHKIPGLITGTLFEASHGTTRPKPEGIKSFTAQMAMFSSLAYPNRPDGTVALYYYDAISVQKSHFLDVVNPSLQSTKNSYVMPIGRWITIEQRVKLNTADSLDVYNSNKDLKNGLAQVRHL